MAFEIPEDRPEKRRRHRERESWALSHMEREKFAAEIGPAARKSLGLPEGRYQAVKEIEEDGDENTNANE